MTYIRTHVKKVPGEIMWGATGSIKNTWGATKIHGEQQKYMGSNKIKTEASKINDNNQLV
jgi:hypothetical protein